MTFPICVVTGTVLNADASPLFDIAVRATVVDVNNETVFISSAAVATLPTVVRTDENGVFEMSLPRGAEVIIKIEEVGYVKQVILPDQSSVNIEDL